ncbi:hypothetical protein [Maribacter hydrothermalis]|uniref:Uncharacterized protein n=1 Tax=Maribacter hydrothermalis TaxID=1836467 RepID=A0A1B7ZF75_9FLAO|nr:hypothetical protein [Maribacter hydrothermalis]APQ17740.1 hypothetical protein BTR34_10555 [Maribacter hydrothermalis]OBR42215.1 hypothetical protein A9200_02180 [Maribacter hydrothermalis]
MRFSIVILCIIVLSGCGQRVSPFFKYNEVFSDTYNHVINDSLQLHHKSFGDVRYAKTKEELTVAVKKRNNLQNVLIYGRTTSAPFYEYFLEMPSKLSRKLKNSNEDFLRDTILGGHKFIFKGFFLDGLNANKDFDQIFKNLIVGDDYKTDLGSFYEVLNSFNKSNRFLNALRVISQYPVSGKNEEFFKLQMELNYASFLGPNNEYYSLLQKWETSSSKDSIAELIIKYAIEGKKKASKFILENTKDERLVMFNENHFYPNHRKLLIELLPDYKELGFKYLALEGLANNQDSLLNSGHPVKTDTGYYTREQNYAELIRLAQSLDFKLVGYESYNENEERELEQAENLYRKTFEIDKNAKVLVLAGIAHIFETADVNGKLWMASIFKENYDINPITFSQTTLNQYKKLTNSLSILSSENFEEGFKTTDYFILNNMDMREIKGNFSYNNKYSKPIQLALFDNSEFKTNLSFFNKVPIKSYLLLPGENFNTTIKIENTRMLIFDEEGKVLENRKVEKN